MPGVRIDRFLTSTAVVLLLCGAAGGALAEPKFGLNLDATTTQPTVTPTSGGTEQPAAKPVEPTSEPATPAPAAKPQASAEHPTTVALAKPDASSDSDATTVQPAATAKPDEPTGPAEKPLEPATTQSTETPVRSPETPPAPTVTEAPAVTPQPAATETDEKPTPAAAAPNAETPTPAASAPAAETATPTAAAPAAETPIPAASAPPATAIADANTPVVDQLREMANGKFDRVLGGKKERAAFRSILFRPQLRAALDHRRQGQRARQGRDRLSRQGRRRRSRSGRLPGAERHVADRSGRVGRRRDEAYSVGRDLRAPCGRGTRSLVARQQRHPLRIRRRRRRPKFSPAWRTPRTSAKRSRPTSRKRRAT